MAIANPFVPLRTAGDQNGRGASVDVNRVQDLIKQALDLICAQITAQSSAAADIQPVFGPPLTDANDVKFIISDMVSGYKLPVQTLTANRTLSLDASGMGVNEDGWIVQIVRQDLSAHLYTVQDHGSATTLFTFQGSGVHSQTATFIFDNATSAWKYLNFSQTTP